MSIRDLVVTTLSNLGMPTPIEVFETVFVKDCCFIGNKFHYEGGYALWSRGWNTVEFHDEEGRLLKLVAIKKAECSTHRRKYVA